MLDTEVYSSPGLALLRSRARAGARLMHLRNLVHRGDDGCKELVRHGEEAAEGDVQPSLDLGVAQGLLWSDVIREVAVGRETQGISQSPSRGLPSRVPPFEPSI